ncbi:MAG: hypothetical protein WA705_20630 [Candidatus Ozemobacteraceae bacterium]
MTAPAKKSSSSSSSGSCSSCACGCACGCFLPVIPLIFLLAALVWFIGPAWNQLRAKPTIAVPAAVSREDRSLLDDKLAAWAAEGASQTAKLELTTAQANALLARFRPPPAEGFVLERLWIETTSGKASLIAKGSGFFQGELTVIFDLLSSPGVLPRLSALHINSLALPTGWALEIGKNMLSSWLNDAAKPQLQLFQSSISEIQFTESGVAVTGRCPVPPPAERDGR